MTGRPPRRPDVILLRPLPPPMLPPDDWAPADMGPDLAAIALAVIATLAAGYGAARILHRYVPWDRIPRVTVVVTTAAPDYVPGGLAAAPE